MAAYNGELVAFDAPPDWEDKTIVAFSAPTEPGQFSPNVVMTKDVLKPGDTLRSYADKQIMELARRLEGFDLVESGDRDVGGVPAMEYRFTWRSEHAELHQHTVMLASAGHILSFTGTATHEAEAALDEAMEHVLASVRFPTAYSPYGSAPSGGAPGGLAGGGGGGGWVPRA